MALNSNQKSSSSASKASKPTFRRPASAGRASGAKTPAGKPTGLSGAPKVAAPRRGSKPAAKSSAKPMAKSVAKPVAAPAKRKLGAPKPVAKPAAAPASRRLGIPTSASAPKVAAPTLGKQRKPVRTPAFLKPVASVLGSLLGAIGGLFKRIPLPKLSRGALLAAAGGITAVLLLALVIANSGLFAARDIQVNGSAHVEQEVAQALVKVPDGTTLLNVNEGPILESLQANPWVAGVDIQREWPNKLIITPVEHTVKAIAYITADELAWCISDQGTWIAPLSLNVVLNADGNEVPLNEDGTVPEGATQLAPFDAALHLANASNALVLTDVPSDAGPKSGEPVSSEVVLAGLEYAKTFTPEFMGQIKNLSVASPESIAAFLTSGIEVSLGTPERIVEKERVVTKLLEQQEGVTYINVREPGAYTFRSAPQE